MTIARRRAAPFQPIAAPMPTPAGQIRAPGLPIAIQDVPAPERVAPVGRLRRCTFRRLDRLEALPGRMSPFVYEVMCLYRGLPAPIALGDIEEARPVCEACTASGIFRPDED